jgi:hypothetical protein
LGQTLLTTEWRTHRQQSALGNSAGRCVRGRAVTGADPDSGDNEERHGEHRDQETESQGVADACVVVAQVVGIVMNSHLPKLPNSLSERLDLDVEENSLAGERINLRI